ncbi:hypothetical protein C1932_05800 [Stenotrophomonas sp. YAU14D1_LEIMI4_1]|nr:hypothetical protein C1932_05800 [Stenotrophomonas sp. YAU14D1_LEIMI4_1]
MLHVTPGMARRYRILHIIRRARMLLFVESSLLDCSSLKQSSKLDSTVHRRRAISTLRAAPVFSHSKD